MLVRVLVPRHLEQVRSASFGLNWGCTGLSGDTQYVLARAQLPELASALLSVASLEPLGARTAQYICEDLQTRYGCLEAVSVSKGRTC